MDKKQQLIVFFYRDKRLSVVKIHYIFALFAFPVWQTAKAAMVPTMSW